MWLHISYWERLHAQIYSLKRNKTINAYLYLSAEIVMTSDDCRLALTHADIKIFTKKFCPENINSNLWISSNANVQWQWPLSIIDFRFHNFRTLYPRYYEEDDYLLKLNSQTQFNRKLNSDAHSHWEINQSIAVERLQLHYCDFNFLICSAASFFFL